MTALADLFKVTLPLLLYFSESRTRSQNSTKILIFMNLQLSMLCFIVKLESIFEDCGNDSRDRHGMHSPLFPLQSGRGIKDFRKRCVEEVQKINVL